MQKSFLSIFVVVCALMTGCATTSRVQTEYRLAPGEKLKLQLTAAPAATEEGLKILRDRLTAQLTSSGLLAQSADKSPRTLEVSVTNYVLRHGASRALLGIMAGSDNLKSTVKIMDLATGKTLSEFEVETKNYSAWGTSGGLLEDHADQIVETLKGNKK